MQGAAASSSLHFMVATDGSPAAHLAFQVVMETLLHAPDKLTISHIFNREKAFLPFDQQPDALKKTYESLTLTMGSKISLWWEEADSKLTTKEQMVNLAQKAQASLIVIGMHGRKGPKA
jgi:nucleotide-binding universal stress UspA family protein